MNEVRDFYEREVKPRLTVEVAYPGVAWHSRGAKEWRGPCPLHGGDRPDAFVVDVATLRYYCHTGCGGGGDVLQFCNGGARVTGARYVELVRQAASLAGVSTAVLDGGHVEPKFTPPAPRPAPPPPAPEPVAPNLESVLKACQRALMQEESPGHRYLVNVRKIPLDLALRFGVGYAPPGSIRWPKDRMPDGRPWPWGRIVFPHTDPSGRVISLYGRAVGRDEDFPGELHALRHRHLGGNKGHFNAVAYVRGVGPLLVCEGPFDALSAMAAGHERAIALFAAKQWRWDWARGVDDLVLALDQDGTGRVSAEKLAVAAAIRGRRVALLRSEAYSGHKDLNSAWCAGVLDMVLPAPRRIGPGTGREKEHHAKL